MLALLDETGHSFRARVGSTWVPVAHAPVLRRVERYRREVTSIVALTAPLRPSERSRIVARHIEGSVHGPDIIAFLRYLRRNWAAGPYGWRGTGSGHRAADVRTLLAAPAGLRAYLLPAYSPDLNPEVQCNASVKKALLNSLPQSIEELRRQARREFRRL